MGHIPPHSPGALTLTGCKFFTPHSFTILHRILTLPTLSILHRTERCLQTLSLCLPRKKLISPLINISKLYIQLDTAQCTPHRTLIRFVAAQQTHRAQSMRCLIILLLIINHVVRSTRLFCFCSYVHLSFTICKSCIYNSGSDTASGTLRA